jgi:hypothetical protein
MRVEVREVGGRFAHRVIHEDEFVLGMRVIEWRKANVLSRYTLQEIECIAEKKILRHAGTA